jgi:NDP-sugar pyrophosphorylase family protein
MSVSECYVIGFGTAYSNAEILRWLDMAALEGLTKASYWYNRVCETIGPSAKVIKQTEFQPSTVVESDRSIPTELYLTSRIRRENAQLTNDIREALGLNY